MPDITSEDKKREEFRRILFDLAKDQTLLEDGLKRSKMYLRLEELYHNSNADERFRHFYSDIFAVLTQIKQDSLLGDINVLGQNLDYLRKNYQSKNKDKNNELIDVSKNIRKLYDHVNLDISRIQYTEACNYVSSGRESISKLKAQINDVQSRFNVVHLKLNDVQSKLNEVQPSVKNLTNDVENTKNQIRNQQRDYIAILGIFAGVVIAFISEIAFSTSVLNNISNVSVYRIIIVALVIGLVAVNVLFGLFYYIDRLVNKEPRKTPLVISNIIFILLMLFTMISWYCGLVEKRNTKVTDTVEETSYTEEITNEYTEESIFETILEQ